MKELYIILLLITGVSSLANAQYKVYKYNNQIIVLPDANQKKELEGVGMTFSNKINFETIKNEAGVEEKKAWLWIKGCGKTYITDSKIFEIKEGAMIRIRMASAGKCEVKSWEKF